jgi:hypothetical protein
MRDARFEEDSLHNPYALIVPREFTQAQRSPMRLVDIVQANHTARPRPSPTLSGTRRPPGTRFSVTISFSSSSVTRRQSEPSSRTSRSRFVVSDNDPNWGSTIKVSKSPGSSNGDAKRTHLIGVLLPSGRVGVSRSDNWGSFVAGRHHSVAPLTPQLDLLPHGSYASCVTFNSGPRGAER